MNDGSSDATENIISALSLSDPLVKLLSFTRNFGKEPALFAGLEHATGDVVIPIDVDLQDPIEVIPLMLQKYQQGAEIVLAKRIDRHTDGYLKRKTAEWFYRLHNKISSPKIEENVGDGDAANLLIKCMMMVFLRCFSGFCLYQLSLLFSY